MIKMRYDLHTHSTYSDGKHTLEQNIAAAIKNGLDKIGLTDHSYRHGTEGLKKHRIEQYLKEAYTLKKAYRKDIDILVGMEFNLFDIAGSVDVLDEFNDAFELKLLGAHKATRYKNIKSAYYILLLQLLGGGLSRREQVVERVTDAYIKAIVDYHIDIIAHPGYLTVMDMSKLAGVCAKSGTLFEINARHEDLSRQDVDKILSAGAQFILGSDSHDAEQIGEHGYAERFIKAYMIPLDRVVNAYEG